ncbi:uncharacterized protein VP01_3281g3, partial [Puccinia sorghi]
LAIYHLNHNRYSKCGVCTSHNKHQYLDVLIGRDDYPLPACLHLILVSTPIDARIEIDQDKFQVCKNRRLEYVHACPFRQSDISCIHDKNLYLTMPMIPWTGRTSTAKAGFICAY